MCVVLTRFKRGANGRVILRGGKPIMECLALQQADKSWELPGLSLRFSLSLSLSFLSLSLSFSFLSLSLSLCLSLSLSFSFSLSVALLLSLSLSFCFSLARSLYPSVSLARSLYPSVSIAIFLCLFLALSRPLLFFYYLSLFFFYPIFLLPRIFLCLCVGEVFNNLLLAFRFVVGVSEVSIC